MWVATLGGLARFDGKTFAQFTSTAFDLEGHRFSAVLAHGPSVLLATTSGRIFRLHRRTGVVTELQNPSQKSSLQIRFGADVDGTVLLFGSGVWGLVETTDQWKFLYSSGDDWAKQLLRRQNGTVWLSGAKMVQCVDGPCPAVRRHVRVDVANMVDDGETFWVGTSNGVEVLVDDHLVRSEIIANPSPVLALANDRLWVASANGVSILDLKTQRLQAIRLGLGRRTLPDPKVSKTVFANRLFHDREGNIWLGSGNFGLFLMQDHYFDKVGPENGFEGLSTLSISATDNGALLSTYCGGLQALHLQTPAGRPQLSVSREHGEGLLETSCINGMLSGNARSLVASDSNLVAVPNDLVAPATLAFEGVATTGETLALHPSVGGIWLGTRGHGLVHVVPQDAPATIDRTPRPSQPLALTSSAAPVGGRTWSDLEIAPQYRIDTVRQFADEDKVQSIAALFADDKRLYVGTDRGLFVAQDQTLRRLPNKLSHLEVQVRAITVDDEGSLWVASYGGGVLYLPAGARQDTSSSPAGRWLRRENGFCTNFVSHMVSTASPEGGPARIWFNSNAGVFWVLATELKAHATIGTRLPCRFLDTGEGNGGAAPSAAMLNDGRLVFPTVEGPAIVAPDDVHQSLIEQQRPWIEEAMIDGVAIDLQQPSMTFPPGNRDLTLELLAPTFGGARQSIFEVSLKRGDEVRHVVGSRRHFFSRLPPGDYVLEARHIGASGARSAPRTLRFTLSPAWYERPILRYGLPLLLLLVLGIFVWTWVRILRGRAELLTKELEERRAKESARQDRDELYRAVFELSATPLLLFSHDGEIVDANNAAERYLRHDTQDPVPTLHHASDDEAIRFQRATHALAKNFIGTTPAPEVDRDFYLVTGSERRVVKIASVLFSLGNVDRYLVTLLDLTQERRAEADRAKLALRAEATKRLEA